jgi:hypothetical protein
MPDARIFLFLYSSLVFLLAADSAGLGPNDRKALAVESYKTLRIK